VAFKRTTSAKKWNAVTRFKIRRKDSAWTDRAVGFNTDGPDELLLLCAKIENQIARREKFAARRQVGAGPAAALKTWRVEKCWRNFFSVNSQRRVRAEEKIAGENQKFNFRR